MSFTNIPQETLTSNNEILFSIGIPAFKSHFLKECINSVLSQTYPNFELIIVNDCSPQPIDEIISTFCDSRILYLKNERNFGAENVVENWNKCLSMAKGNYFILMGDDDKMEPDYLEEFLSLMSKYPKLDIYHCRSRIIDEDSSVISLTSSWPEYESVYENIWHRINGFRSQFISDFVYRTSELKAKGGFYNLPLAWASDDISSYILSADKGIAHTNKPVFNYRENRFTITSTGNYELKMKAIILEYQWFKSFLENKPNNEFDEILYWDIVRIMDPYFQRRKKANIYNSVRKKRLRNSIMWFFKRRVYEFSLKELAGSIIGRI